MRTAFITLAILAIAAVSAASVADFEAFKAKFGKQYASATEEAKRFKVFSENMKSAAALAKTNPLAKFGANEFADMTAEEFKSRHNADAYYRINAAAAKGKPVTSFTAEQKQVAAGKTIDWRAKGAVTAVKNQGQCGSCWSFSTTGGIEGQWFLAGHELVSLSEQEFVSCDTIDSGCQGGLMDNAFTWVLANRNGSIVTEASYPYVSGGGNVPACNMNGRKFGAVIDGFKNIAKTEDDMAAFVFASGPLSIAVDATSWQTYEGGILTNCISNQIDHGVLIVGLDDSNTPPYWIVKNSWGASWGESGYIRIEKGTDQCLLTSYPCSSTVEKNGPTPPPGPHPHPPPPSPPTPGNSFVQKRCNNSKCTECEELRFTQGECIVGASSSYKATCATDALIVESFIGRTCQGAGVVTSNALDVCSIVFDSKATESFVMNSCNAGPAPPSPPTPPTPPTPPAPTGTFTQEQCETASCTNCRNGTFPLGQCLKLNGGGSAIAKCTPDSLTLTEYVTSTDCTGMSIPSSMPLNQCLKDTTGTYIENICTTSAVRVAESAIKTLKTTKRH